MEDKFSEFSTGLSDTATNAFDITPSKFITKHIYLEVR